MVVSTHRLGITMRTSLSGPQRRRVLHSDQHFAFLRNVVHSAHTPGIPQRQYLMKHFLGNHPCSLNHPQKPSTHKKRRGTSFALDYPGDGTDPQAGLILSGNTLYGTASAGGSGNAGTVFAVHTNGTGFTSLHSFTATDYYTGTNSDGANPYAGLILSGNTLYGTASAGGSGNAGTVFAVHTNGTGFTNLHSLTATDFNTGTNSDGAYPNALILSGNTLYGTA